MADGAKYHLGVHATPLEYHGTLIGDPHRVVAYERAIRVLVRPGDVVLDLGAGTGILAMLAARRGARVHAVESGPVAALAEELVRHNRLDHRVTVHRGDVRDLDVAEPVDLVIGDFMGRFLVDDGMLGAVEAARAWMKPAARFSPRRIELFLVPIRMTVPAVEVFSSDVLGLDLRPALPYTQNTCYAALLGPPSVLAQPQSYHVMAPPRPPPPFDRTLVFEALADDLFTGFAGFFVADLADGVQLSTAPGVQTHWGQYLFPVPRVRVARGDRIEVRLRLEPPLDDPNWRWSGRVLRGDDAIATWDLESAQRLGERPWEGAPIAPPLVRADVLAVNEAASADFFAGRLYEAIDGYERCIRSLSPEQDDLARPLYENLGLARYNLGDHEGAARAFLRAVQPDPAAHAQACRFLVNAFQAAGRIHDAATWLKRYRQLHGEHPDYPSGA